MALVAVALAATVQSMEQGVVLVEPLNTAISPLDTAQTLVPVSLGVWGSMEAKGSVRKLLAWE